MVINTFLQPNQSENIIKFIFFRLVKNTQKALTTCNFGIRVLFKMSI